jgi:hypothetical protein
LIGDVPPDLRQLLDEALTRVHQDITRVWLRASLTYESGVQDKKAILVGGSWSPFFLDKRAENPSPWDMVGAGALIYSPRILHVDAIDESDKLEDWVAPLQGFARAADGLLLIADSVTNSELLATLVINNARGTLACALVKPGKEPPPSLWNGVSVDANGTVRWGRLTCPAKIPATSKHAWTIQPDCFSTWKNVSKAEPISSYMRAFLPQSGQKKKFGLTLAPQCGQVRKLRFCSSVG